MIHFKRFQFIGFSQLPFFIALCILLTTIQGISASSHLDSPDHCEELQHQDGDYYCNNQIRNGNGSTCHFRCSSEGYSACRGNVTAWRCINGVWVGAQGGQSGARDGQPQPSCCATDTSAPSISCPLSRRVYADRNNVSATATWEEPKVSDNSGLEIQLERTPDSKSPGSIFEEGRHVIRYTATDASSNSRSCMFTIEVIVHRCETLSLEADQHMSCTNNDYSIFGTTCTFSCLSGMCVDGSLSMTCEKVVGAGPIRAEWGADQPTCREITCQYLIPPENGYMDDACNNANHAYGSRCGFECEAGYEITGDSVLRCQSNPLSPSSCLGTWSGEYPTCRRASAIVVDREPPTFTESERKFVYTDRDSYYANINYDWEPIMAIDDVSGSISSTLVSVNSLPLPIIPRPSSLPEGLYTLVYEATDDAGNVGVFIMELVVEVIRCTSLSIQPPLIITCRNGTIYGSVCSFECPLTHGLCVNGATSTKCENFGSNTNPDPGWTESIPSCLFKRCPQLDPPINGHLVGRCATHFNSTCLIACDSGFSLVEGNSRRQCHVTEGRTCDISGYWSGDQPSCQESPAGPQFPQEGQITVLANIQETYAVLNYSRWEPVRAIDSSSGNALEARLVRIHPPVYQDRPSRLSEGTYVFTYQAEDAAGNIVLWNLDLIIRVVRCPELDIALYNEVSCSHANMYGSMCTLGCATGRCLTGNHVITCQISGFWDSTVTTCQNARCPEFLPPLNGYLSEGSCPRYYGADCHVACNAGYTLFHSGAGFHPIECTHLGLVCGTADWSGSVRCLDIDPPIFPNSQQPRVTKLKIPQGETRAYLNYTTWEPIIARDNVSGDITADMISFDGRGGFKPYALTEGNYTLIYEAVDETGNRATLSMILAVEVVRCSEPEPTQYGQRICNSTDYVIGTSCTIQCEIGYCLASGADTMVCIRGRGGGGGSRQQDNAHWDINQPTCRSYTDTRCIDLDSPSNGYNTTGSCLSNFGSRCEFACNLGYRLEGDSVRYCRMRVGNTCDAAFWSGEPARCQAIYCPSLEEVFPAFHTGCNKSPGTDIVGATCQWHCPPGYRAVGRGLSNCLADGTWDNTNFTCQREGARCPPLNVLSTVDITPASCNNQPGFFGTYCWFTCGVPGYELKDSIDRTVIIEKSYANCTADGQWWSDGYTLPFKCVDTESPRFTECLESRTFYAPRSSVLGSIIWNIGAIDNSGDDPDIRCNVPQATGVIEGTYHVSCIAIDRADNGATCDTAVSVRVRRCQPSLPVLPNHGQIDPRYSCDDFYGASCLISCMDGYVLQGNSQVICEYDTEDENTFWTNSGATCQPINTQCEDIPSEVVTNAHAQGAWLYCSDVNRIGSVCTFYCALPDFVNIGDSVQMECQTDGTWDVDVSTLQPSCVDMEPPHIIRCPNQPITAELSPVTFKAEVHFDPPEAIDNSRQTPRVETTPADITSPYSFTTNTLVIYEFFDEEGLSSICSFRVIVINNLPPIITCPGHLFYPSPNSVLWQIPHARNPMTGATIVTLCDRQPGDYFSPGEHRITCSARNPDNDISVDCAFDITVRAQCQPLAPPAHGSFDCVVNNCTVMCDEGYGILRGQPFELICGDSGWQPTSDVPDCKKIRPAFEIRQDIIIKVSGDCTGVDTPQQVQRQVATFVNSIPTDILCLDVCSKEVSVICEGSTIARRKRSDDVPVMTICITTNMRVIGDGSNTERMVKEINNEITMEINNNNLPFTIEGIPFETIPFNGHPCQTLDPVPDCYEFRRAARGTACIAELP